MKSKNPLCPPSYHWFGMIQRMWSYLATIRAVDHGIYSQADYIISRSRLLLRYVCNNNSITSASSIRFGTPCFCLNLLCNLKPSSCWKFIHQHNGWIEISFTYMDLSSIIFYLNQDFSGKRLPKQCVFLSKQFLRFFHAGFFFSTNLWLVNSVLVLVIMIFFWKMCLTLNQFDSH